MKIIVNTRHLLQGLRKGNHVADDKPETNLEESNSSTLTYTGEIDELFQRSIVVVRQKSLGNRSKRVSFGTLEIRAYPVTLGDNPACSHGPPITIEWEPVASDIVPVKVWEFNRRSRRRGEELRTHWQSRRSMLKGDVSDLELLEANKELHKMHKRRAQTLHRLRYEEVEIFAQSLFRKVKRFFTGFGDRTTQSPALAHSTQSPAPGERRRPSTTQPEDAIKTEV